MQQEEPEEMDEDEDDLDEEFFQDDLFGFDETQFNPEQDRLGNGAEMGAEAETRPRHALDDENWLKQLFRKAAQALHPDREQDEVKRELKQKQMRELLRARKQGDVMTLLSIYTEHVDGSDLEIAEQEMSRLCDLLEEQVYDLEDEQDNYISSHPYRQMVFEILYAATSKGRKKRIAEWQAYLDEEEQLNQQLRERLHTLKDLKPILEMRNYERQQAQMMLLDLVREFGGGF
ncbi:MAG: hypothetical protein HQL47_03450 [Gammaproteobacteria bacterium]|nr:hypothetical protein [Gammaproteobacteria bacterium]